ncbi:hypothetical protein WA026_015062 [Henosepilachna vigintioctopunctata]|uniref:Uncharacterized protein n=1 Tax=Henosepilachna vigintioctopunctata TaxID=420089 RepID=A0AAW1UC29_9CUCU
MQKISATSENDALMQGDQSLLEELETKALYEHIRQFVGAKGANALWAETISPERLINSDQEAEAEKLKKNSIISTTNLVIFGRDQGILISKKSFEN